MFVFPKITPPAFLSLDVTVDSYGGINPSNTFADAVVARPTVKNLSFTASGIPESGRDFPFFADCSVDLSCARYTFNALFFSDTAAFTSAYNASNVISLPRSFLIASVSVSVLSVPIVIPDPKFVPQQYIRYAYAMRLQAPVLA